jgi:hypothetical protein
MKMMRSDRFVGWVERSDTHHFLRERWWVSLRSTHPTTSYDHAAERLHRHVFVISRRLAERSLTRVRRLSHCGKRVICVVQGRWRRGCITFVLDPCDFLTRLGTDHICGLRHKFHGGFHPSEDVERGDGV